MRAFEPQIPARDFDNRLYECLKNINGYLQQVDSAFGLIGRGFVPVAGAQANVPGTTLGGVTRHRDLLGLDADDHPNYAYLPGRLGGQTLFGSRTSGTTTPTWVDTEQILIQDFERLTATTSWSGQAVDVVAPVGRIVLLSLATHETTSGGGTPTGNSNNHISIADTQSNTWVKLREYTANEGAGGPGTEVVTISLWYCKITTELTTSDTLTFNSSVSLPCWAVESRQFTSGVANPTIILAGNAADRFDTDSDPGSQTISGLTSGEYLFVRGIAIHGTPGGANINLYNVSSVFTEFVTPHNNSTIQSEAADRQIGARGEFAIATGTGATSNPSVDAATVPDSGSIFLALKIAGTVTGDLALQSIDATEAALVHLEDQTVRISGAGDTSDRMVRFDNTTGTLLSYIRASDGAFIGPIGEPTGIDHGGLSGLFPDDDHPQYLLLAGRAGGQMIGGGSHAGANPSDIAIDGRLLLGTGLAGVAFANGESLRIQQLLFSNVSPINFSFDQSGLSGAATGTINGFNLAISGTPGYSSGAYTLRAFALTATPIIPAGVSLNSLEGGRIVMNVSTQSGTVSALRGLVVQAQAATTGTGTTPTHTGLQITLSTRGQITTTAQGLLITQLGTITAACTTFNAIELQSGLFGDSDVVTWQGLVMPTVTGPGTIRGFVIGNMVNQIEGKLRIGSATDPVHLLELAAGTATVAPLKLTSGTNLTTPIAGVVEYDGTTFFITPVGTTRQAVPIMKQTEVDFGSTPVESASFVVVDTAVTTAMHITGQVAYEAPTGKDLDELEMDSLECLFAPGAGQLTIFIRGREGYIADKFKINYVLG